MNICLGTGNPSGMERFVAVRRSLSFKVNSDTYDISNVDTAGMFMTPLTSD